MDDADPALDADAVGCRAPDDDDVGVPLEVSAADELAEAVAASIEPDAVLVITADDDADRVSAGALDTDCAADVLADAAAD